MILFLCLWINFSIFVTNSYSDRVSFIRKNCKKRCALFLWLKTWEIFNNTREWHSMFPTLFIAWVCCPSIRVFGFSQDLQLQIVGTQFHAWTEYCKISIWLSNINIGNRMIMIPYSSRYLWGLAYSFLCNLNGFSL